MSKPKIYLKRRSNEDEGQLYLYYSYGGDKRLEFYTGFRIKNSHFNDQYWLGNKKPINKKCTYHDSYNRLFEEMELFAVSLVVNERIFDNAELKKRLSEEFKATKIEEPVLTDYKAGDFISYCEFVQSERKQGKRSIVNGNRQGLNYKPNSLRNPGTTITSLKEFAKFKMVGSFSFSDIDVKFYNDYRDYLLNEKKRKISTFSTRVRDIKAFMHEAMDDKAHDNNEFKNKRFIAPKYESTGIALTLEEIKKIKDAIIPEEWHHVRDLFLIACYSALRFSDFSKLEITDVDDGFIRIKQDKTENRVSIPIMKDMREVLSKYGGSLPPPCTNQHFNRTIKKICASKSVGLDRVYEIDKDGKDIMWSAKITSHTGRRSYATNMFKLGVPTLLIMSATGHKKEEMFLRYIKATNEEKSRLLAEWMNKLGI
ncbi:site-specific tyrosine recombinase XerC [Sphingobacterium spiritivorum]|uniref:Site-specific tyrosine recombinase XerC n=1 Tax=Sphingobacterium spiritivorum TaxID=258 RepID=A0A380CDQ7_SPHSI|nr:site-specific integrase [Sphingobacterium spiritivorum]SUJ18429.1 site-specific tyrosine recombinase XerC [Sphingobacterium spiritivorum]